METERCVISKICHSKQCRQLLLPSEPSTLVNQRASYSNPFLRDKTAQSRYNSSLQEVVTERELASPSPSISLSAPAVNMRPRKTFPRLDLRLLVSLEKERRKRQGLDNHTGRQDEKREEGGERLFFLSYEIVTMIESL